MQHPVKKRHNYSRSFKEYIVYAVVRDGLSIANVCTQHGIDEMSKVREWVRAFMKKRNMVRIPRGLTKRGKAPRVIISEPINRQFQRYEEIIMYQESLIEAFYSEADEETKKKLLEKLSPSQQARLKKTGKL